LILSLDFRSLVLKNICLKSIWVLMNVKIIYKWTQKIMWRGVMMKVTELLGKKVLDKDAMGVGKISDMDIDAVEGTVSSITISSSDFSINRDDYEITNQDIDQVGDYVLLKIDKTELDIRAESSQETEKRKFKL
jgi:sporulation protein YlmC with PRC-barrel domain